MALPTGVEENPENNVLVCPTAQEIAVENIATIPELSNLDPAVIEAAEIEVYTVYSAQQYVADLRFAGCLVAHVGGDLFIGEPIANYEASDLARAKARKNGITSTAICEVLRAEGGAI